MSRPLILILLVIVLLIILYIVYRKHFKRLKVPSVCLITGGVKTGKSLLSVKLAIKDYRRRHRIWYLKSLIRSKKKEPIEEPLFYTNTFVQFNGYNPKRKKSFFNKPHKLNDRIKLIELEHLLRDKRFNYGSVIYVCESSLMADNQDFNNQIRNAELSLFNKLIAHETKGGAVYYDTQSPLDNHYSIKRVMSTFFFIQKSLNLWLFRVLYVREMVSSDIAENNFIDDVDNTTRKVLIGRWWYKRYDRYYYSYLTDNLGKDSKEVPFYTGGLNSFNPLYRKLAIGGKEKRKLYEEEMKGEKKK